MKWSAREDKRKWLEKRTAAEKKAAENGRSKELYSIKKSIMGERRKQEIVLKTDKACLGLKQDKDCKDG